jgi:hypothetical protein
VKALIVLGVLAELVGAVALLWWHRRRMAELRHGRAHVRGWRRVHLMRDADVRACPGCGLLAEGWRDRSLHDQVCAGFGGEAGDHIEADSHTEDDHSQDNRRRKWTAEQIRETADKVGAPARIRRGNGPEIGAAVTPNTEDITGPIGNELPEAPE